MFHIQLTIIFLFWRRDWDSPLYLEREEQRKMFSWGCHDRRKSTNSCNLVITYVQINNNAIDLKLDCMGTNSIRAEAQT